MDLLEQVADLLPVTRYKNYLATRCVFHEDSSPSLMIYEKSYICLSCGAKGSTKHLLDYLNGVPARSASSNGFTPTLWKYMSHMEAEEVAIEAHNRLLHNWSVTYYLHNRGIDARIRQLMIGFLDGYYIFPIFSAEKDIVGLVARSGPVIQAYYNVRYIVPKGQPPSLLYCPNWKEVIQGNQLFVTYGIFDAISVSMAGYGAVSGTTGHNIYADSLQNQRKMIYIIMDGDNRDYRPASKLALDLGWRGKLVSIKYPEGTKDCNEILVKYGLKYLQNLLSKVIASDSKYKWNLVIGAE